MPGLFGIAGIHGEADERRAMGYDMRELLCHNPAQKKDALFDDGILIGGRVHLGLLQPGHQPDEGAHQRSWLIGELYNAKEIARKHGIDADSHVALIAQVLFRQDRADILRELDGIYAAVVYDSAAKTVSLVTDRYGLRHLYFLHLPGRVFCWASETKAFLAVPLFRPVIDETAVQQFVHTGQVLAHRTWFRDVQMADGGTITTYDMESRQLSSSRYWDWGMIKPYQGRLNRRHLVAELGAHFTTAVARRARGPHRLGLTLSGGLDSRAIMAAVPPSTELVAVTFGRDNSLDVALARRAAAVRGIPHHTATLTATNWLRPRLAGIWQTDGHLNVLHMHALEAAPVLAKNLGVNLNGFSGDAVLGGSFLRSAAHLSSKDRATKWAQALGCPPDVLERAGEFETYASYDFYLLQNRVRRFTAAGTTLLSQTIEHRKPFFDNDLIEFAYSLPDRVRYQGHLYTTMLLELFPQYFKDIPWQKTGYPINPHSRSIQRAQRLWRRGKRFISRQAEPSRSYTDYPAWLRQEPARSFIDTLLSGKDAIYPEYVNPADVTGTWHAHLAGEDRAEKVGRYVTLELWLQQVLCNRFRAWDPIIEESDAS